MATQGTTGARRGRKASCKRKLSDGNLCNKPFDHVESTDRETKKHGYTPPKQYAPLTFGTLTVTKVKSKSVMAQKRRRRNTERDKEQLAVDKIVTEAYEEWQKAGSPTDWNDSAGMLVGLPVEQVETLVRNVRRAGQFLGVKIRFGETEVNDGIAEVIFIAMDKPEDEDE